jgi:hypothetical protein
MSDITVLFTTHSSATHAFQDADATPVGTLYINGTANAATVTVTNITTGRYKASVTLPAPTVGDVRDLLIAATVDGIADGGVIWSDTYAADVTLAATQGSYAPAKAGDAMTLTAAYDKAKDDVLTPLAAVDGKADTLLTRATEARLAELDAANLPADVDAILTDTGTTLPALIGLDFGTDTCTLTITDGDGDPIADAQVYVGSDATPTTQTRTKTTDSLGQVVFDLTAGTTYYLWVFSDGFTGTNPTAFVAVAD